jgi:hypothetical protein
MAGTLVRLGHLPTLYLAVVTAIVVPIALAGQAPPNPPVARKHPRTTTLHGVTLTDNYAWMRQKNSPAVKAYLDAENAYTEAGTKHLATLQGALYREMLGRIKESDEQVPVWEDGYWYYTRTEKGKAYPIFCRRKGSPDAPEEVSRARWPGRQSRRLETDLPRGPDCVPGVHAICEGPEHGQSGRVDQGRLERHGVG